MSIATIDFETYSELSLPEVGPVVYTCHPSTRILCLSWRIEHDNLDDFQGLWLPDGTADDIQDLFDVIYRGYLVEAHNAMFEKCVWRFIGQDKLSWPAVPVNNWRCSAAKAAACALPRALEDAAVALDLQHKKNMDGHRVMKRVSKPPKITKKYKGPTAEDYEKLYEYCADDTLVERELSASLPALHPIEFEIWQMDQEMNARGIDVDIEGAKRAVALASNWTNAMNTELEALTQGKVKKATQRQALLAWLKDQGVKLYDTKALTLDTLLDDAEAWEDVEIETAHSERAKRAIEIMRSIGKSSVSKYQKIIETSYEGRLHDTMMYAGATTLRWTGKRVQPHNFPRGKFKTNEDMERAWQMIRYADPEWIGVEYGDLMHFLSNALKGVIVAPEGEYLHGGDYEQVETRFLFWLAGEETGLDVFRNPVKGVDIYTVTATDIYGRSITKDDEDERQIGKRAVLGLGFGMGFIKFLITCRGFGIRFTTEQIVEILGIEKLRETADYINKKRWPECAAAGMTLADLPELAFMFFVVTRYRTRYQDTICKLWKYTENCAKAAFLNPGGSFTYGRCTWHYDGKRFLTNTKPNGCKLYYPFPSLDDEGLTFMGVHPKTRQWMRERTYGGKLVENMVQAIARDFMAAAMVRCEKSGKYKVVLTVHDEVVARAKDGNSVEYAALLSECPPWAVGIPVKAGCWQGKRYRK